MVGLAFPEDFAAWQRWHQRQLGTVGVVRIIKSRLRPDSAQLGTLWLPEEAPESLVVLDHDSPSCRMAIHEPLAHGDLRRIAVLGRGTPPRGISGHHAVPFESTANLPTSIMRVFSLGGHLPLSQPVAEWAVRREVQFCVIQHGLLTPWAPPLTPGTHLLAWSEDDAVFWRSGRRDVTTEVVGSQMMWEAAHAPKATLRSDQPVMLGQLHGTELGRLDKLRAYRDFCVGEGARYRPHPNEKDVLSRLGHQWLRRCGVGFDTSRDSVVDLGQPVVSIFSTGTLEAAQRGLPAWVFHPNPAAWVTEFWERYALSPFGESPTPAQPVPDEAPARRVAAIMTA